METIHVTVNGVPRALPKGTTVRMLCATMGLHGPVAVERNREIVRRAAHETTELVEGDAVEIVHLVGGG